FFKLNFHQIMLSIKPYEQPQPLPSGAFAAKAVGYSNVSVNENFEESLIEGPTVENVGSVQVVITGGRKGMASRARVYEKVVPQDDYLREDVSLASPEPLDPIIYKRNPTWKRPDNYANVDEDDLGTGDYYPYPVPPVTKAVKRQGSTLILPRSSSLTNSVLSTERILALVFGLLPPAVVQRVSRVNTLWRNVALLELARNSVTVELSWNTSATATAKWTAKFLIDSEYDIDPSTAVIQLRPWNFGSLHHANNLFLLKANATAASNYTTVIPVPRISSLSFHFPSSNDPLKTFKKTPKNNIVYSTTTNHFAVSQQLVMSSDTTLASNVLLTENCGFFFGANGCSVDVIRVGALKAGAVALVKLSSSMYSQSRWIQLVRFESEIIQVLTGTPRTSDSSASPLEKCFESCAVRNYLSCPEDLRVPPIAKLNKVAHRVDILLMLDMTYAQRRERLNEYHLEAWKIWMTLGKGAESDADAEKVDLIQLEEDDSGERASFEEVDLSAESIPHKSAVVETLYPSVGGGIALRVSGYTGSLKDYESVYDHIQNVLMVEFS
ncbi:hypothetical protein BDR26DRAFT_862545, partial [Obelidium mucronatum]